MANTQILPPDKTEAVDTPKKFTNIDSEVFEFSWNNKPYSVNPGKTEIYPKYLVNYAAMHLSKKIRKRNEFAKYKDPKERSNSRMDFFNENDDKELQTKMVAANFEQEKKEEVKEEPKKEFICEECQEKFETEAQLRGHKLGKHSK